MEGKLKLRNRVTKRTLRNKMCNIGSQYYYYRYENICVNFSYLKLNVPSGDEIRWCWISLLTLDTILLVE